MTTTTPAQLLAARDDRVRRRRSLQGRHPGSVVVGVTLVTPGPVKSSPTLVRIRDRAVTALRGQAAELGWPVLDREERDGAAGPEAHLVLDVPTGDATTVKRVLVGLEDSCPGGRLWDLDVHDGERTVSRTSLGRAPRRCLVCAEPAHACARSRAHDLADLTTAVEALRAAHR
ncbi:MULTISPECIES: citrate lyase holo-[acyl-carrier protein] synthase [Arsenicicoccus]|uniref:citrate lyase holo-[acyl-carrier protein] synthase n=1 Tax=Arsenicicoccus TaxID=267408 RepID=UPI00257B2B44|nr:MULTISPECIES: citrate lyase holo-[acyl-carrier protein] synthase [Arsenicicoccus]